MTGKQVIKLKRRRLIYYAFFNLCIIICIFLLLFKQPMLPLFIKLICCLIALPAFFAFLLLLPILAKSRGLVLSSLGLSDCTHSNPIGPVPWSDFKAFELALVKTEVINMGKKSGRHIMRTYLAAELLASSPFSAIVSNLNSNIFPGGGSESLLAKFPKHTLFINLDALACRPNELISMLKLKLKR